LSDFLGQLHKPFTMKSTFITLFLLLAIELQGISQSFTKHFTSSEDEYAYTSINTPDGGYLIYMVAGEWNGDPGRRAYRDILLKTDAQGNILDSLVFSYNTDSLNFMITQLVPYGNEFLIQGAYFMDNLQAMPVSCRIMRYSYDFELHHDTSISKPGFYASYGSMILNSKGNIVIPGLYNSKDMSSYFSFCREMTIDGDSIREYIYSEYMPYSSIIELPEKHCYNLVDVTRIVEIDSNLAYVKLLYHSPSSVYPNTMVELFDPKTIDGTSYLVSGRTLNYDGGFEGAWGVFNTGIWENVFSFGSVDTNDQMKGMDFISTENIFSSLSQMPNYFVPEFSEIDNQMLLYCTNINSSVNWMKRYDGKGWIHAGFPLATTDGGCLWIGNYWDWHNKTHHDYDVIIMKINPDGSFFEGINEPKPLDKSIVVFPNPGINFEFTSDIDLSKLLIYNVTGKIVVNKVVTKGNNKVATKNLNAGVYFYQFIKDNQIVGSGKWIKISE
jgi:hypothetical protein